MRGILWGLPSVLAVLQGISIPDWNPDAGLPTPRAVTARPSGLGPTDTHQVVGSPHQMRVLFRPGASGSVVL